MNWTALLLFLFIGLSGFSQEEHVCALKHTGATSVNRSLSATQEIQANKYNVGYYGLDLAMSNQDRNVAGTATIKGKSTAILDTILLELFSTFTISDLRLDAVSVPFVHANSILKIPVVMSSGTDFTLEIDYAGTSPTSVQNPFGGSGVNNSYNAVLGDKITYTISCPFFAYEWFPCKQILKDKADSSNVTVTVPDNCLVASNGVLQDSLNLGNGSIRYHWKNSNPINYYLIFASIAPYVEYVNYAYPAQLPGDSIMIQSYLYGGGANLASMTTQCDLLPGFLEHFSDLYGLYPFYTEKYGINAAPFGGGMEHQTMSSLGVFEKKIFAHELSHQWWGNHIGLASFADVWLSEGFAVYSEYLMLEQFYPAETTALVSGWHNSVKSSPSGSVWFTDTLNVSRIYNSRLTYKKGGSIIHTLRNIVNDDAVFFQTLRDFQIDFHDSVAVGIDIKNAFEASTGLDLTNFFQEWYFGEGYPTYTSRWNMVGNDLLIEITHSTSAPTVTPTFTNPIEITFTRNGSADTTVRFSIQSNSDQFFVYNIGEVTGVSAIDPSNWVINNYSPSTYDPTFVASIDENKTSSLKIYPNPSENTSTILMDKAGDYSVKIMDSKGKLIESKTFSNSTLLELGNYPGGTYIVEIRELDNQHSYSRKLIKF